MLASRMQTRATWLRSIMLAPCIAAAVGCVTLIGGERVQGMDSGAAVMLFSQGQLQLLDVRSTGERLAGRVAGAAVALFGPDNPELWISRRASEREVEQFLVTVRAAFPDKGTAIATFCNIGSRSAVAAKVLSDDGYRNVSTIVDGYLGNHLGPGLERQQ